MSNPKIKADILERDYLPEPPTPTSNADPVGKSRILQILTMCSMASVKRTRSM